MRTKIMLVLAVAVFVALNYGIYAKQRIVKQGETVLLELAPVDPRSLMQGDYMRLRYAIENQISQELREVQAKRGHLVVQTDSDNVAHFVRFHAGESLGENEKLLNYVQDYALYIRPDSFLFQEGHAHYYEDAKYGVFRFNGNEKVLVGLAGENREMIRVPTNGYSALP